VAAKDIGDKVAGVGGKIEDVGDKVERVAEKVQFVIDGARGFFSQYLKPSNIYTILSDGTHARTAAQETGLAIQQAAFDIDEIKCSWFP
jgi:hypothetical protein